MRLKKVLELQEKINTHVGEHVDILSNQDLTRVLEKMCVRPTAFTKTGAPSWDSETLEGYCTPFTDMLAEYNLQCLTVTKDGFPGHPLRLHSSLQPIPLP